MGLFSSKAIDPRYYLVHLKQNNIKYDSRIRPIFNPDVSTKNQLIDTISQSYYGDEKHSPERASEWNHERYFGKDSSITVYQQQEYQYYASWILNFSLNYGLVYALYDDHTNNIAGVTCIFPPHSFENGKLLTCRRLVSTFMDCGIPRHLCSKESKERKDHDKKCEVFFKQQKYGLKAYASKPLWYQHCIAVKPEYQNKGIGSSLMNLFCGLADLDNMSGYLQCTGDQTISFFQKFQFDSQEKFYLQEKFLPQTKNKHISAYMLRLPKDSRLADSDSAFETTNE